MSVRLKWTTAAAHATDATPLPAVEWQRVAEANERTRAFEAEIQSRAIDMLQEHEERRLESVDAALTAFASVAASTHAMVREGAQEGAQEGARRGPGGVRPAEGRAAREGG